MSRGIEILQRFDHAALRDVVTAIFEKLGYEVEDVNRVGESLHHCDLLMHSTSDPDVLIGVQLKTALDHHQFTFSTYNRQVERIATDVSAALSHTFKDGLPLAF